MRKLCLAAVGFAMGSATPSVGQVSVQSLAQSTGVIVSAEYQPRYPISVSHGQIITLTVAGLGNDISSRVRAESNPLPRELAGVSAVIYQADRRFDAPILQVEPLWTCPFSFTAPLTRGEKCGTLLSVTLQVPFELDKLRGSFGLPVQPPQLVIYYKGAAGAAVDLQLGYDTVRLLRVCDLPVRSPVTPVTMVLNCDYAVGVHADSSRITLSNPAIEGESVTVFAFGLGVVDGGPLSGRPASDPIPVEGFSVGYGFGSEPKSPLAGTLVPEFIGLGTGGAGLYQVNFKVPQVPKGLVACRDTPGWNFAISVTRQSSDWAGLCVAPANDVEYPESVR